MYYVWRFFFIFFPRAFFATIREENWQRRSFFFSFFSLDSIHYIHLNLIISMETSSWYIYIYICFFNQWHGESALRSIWLWWDVLSVHKNVFESSKGGTFKLANPTELSTELSVNQVDPLSTIFSFIQLLVFSLQIYFLCLWFFYLHSCYSI